MYFSLKQDCYFRKYDQIGYIVRPLISLSEVIDEIGCVFIEKLSYTPCHIDEIADKLKNDFEDVTIDELREDAIEFYFSLVSAGFLNCSENLNASVYTNEIRDILKEKKVLYESEKEKMEETTHFINEYFKNNPHLVSFQIELTNKCNERCIHCYIPHETKDTDIECEMMFDVIRQCREMNVLTLTISGGEPMLHPHFCEFLRYAKDLDMHVIVLSNLTIMSDEIIDALLYRHPTSVNVSLYSMDPSVHDGITKRNNSLETTKNNILKLIDNNIPIGINCPVMKQNKDSFQDVLQWSHQMGCDVTTDYLIMARSDGTTDNLDNRLTEDDLKTVIKKYIENDITIQSNIKASLQESAYISQDPESRVCGVGITALCMAATGVVYPCVGWQKFSCGNLKDEKLRKIWKESSLLNYLRKLRMKDFKECLGCENQEYCVMCMSRNSNEDKDGNIFNIPQITCEAAKIHKKTVEEYKRQMAGRN